MRSSLELQRSLFRHQQRQIARAVATASPAFRAYERRYRRASSSYQRIITTADVERRVAQSDVVYVGDYHTLALAQQAYLRLVNAAVRTGRSVVLALEFVEHRHQRAVDDYLSNKINERRFLARIGHPYRGPFDIWPHFKPIFDLARARGLEVVAIDRRARGERSLAVRDQAAAEVIAPLLARADRPLIVTLMGQFHVAPAHLPAVVSSLAPPHRALVVFQNAEEIWWRLAERGQSHRVEAVEVDASSVCLISASPMVCQRSFLDYVEAESGDTPIEERGITATVKHLATTIGKVAGVDVKHPVRSLEVFTPAELPALERLIRKTKFNAEERAHLKRHVLSGESAFIPRARAVWLASLSLNHAAEESAHFVRACAIGLAMERPRRSNDAFWARCLEEALGFFGSKLVNPARECVSLDQWAATFRSSSGDNHRTAAFVLAIAAAESDGPAALRKLLPVGNLTLFLQVSHALGYILGDALFRAFEQGELSKATVQRMFHDPLEDAAMRWLEWRALVRRGPRRSPGAAQARARTAA